MKKFLLFLFIFLFSQNLVSANNTLVLETSKISKALDYADKDTLVAFDLDNTLITGMQQLGSYVWFVEETMALKKNGLSTHQANDLAVPCFLKLQDHLDTTLTEPNVPQVLRDLQKKGAKIVGLTARRKELDEVTFSKIKELDIHFDNDYLLKKDFTQPYPVKYKDGVLFAHDKNNKGVVLLEFLENIKPKHKFKKIIFVDDVMKNVENVKVAMETTDYEFIGLYYDRLNYKYGEYNHTFTENQMKNMNIKECNELYKNR